MIVETKRIDLTTKEAYKSKIHKNKEDQKGDIDEKERDKF